MMLVLYLMNLLISLLTKLLYIDYSEKVPPDKLRTNLLQITLRPLLSYGNLHLKDTKNYFNESYNKNNSNNSALQSLSEFCSWLGNRSEFEVWSWNLAVLWHLLGLAWPPHMKVIGEKKMINGRKGLKSDTGNLNGGASGLFVYLYEATFCFISTTGLHPFPSTERVC